MSQSTIHYDMYDRDIFASPYEVLRRLRDECPLYYNEHTTSSPSAATTTSSGS